MAANKLDFNGEVKELRIGKTFLKDYKEEFYHTIRYDFKPASVDTHKVGTMEVDDKEVTLSVPHIESAGSQAAVFKGNKNSASKECILVIDNVTGEIVLEKLSHSIRVKKTRAEKNNKKNAHGIPSSHDSHSHKPSLLQSSYANSSARGLMHKTGAKGNSPNPAKQPASSSSSLFATGSMPMLNQLDENKNDGMSSESSSDSDSGSSSSSDSDSDSDQGHSSKRPNKSYPNNTPHNGLGVSTQKSSPTSVLSDLELSEED